MRCWPTRPTPAVLTERYSKIDPSPLSSPNAPTSKGHRLRRGSAVGRPVSYDRERYRDRNVIERSYGQRKQWRGLATCYDKLAVIFCGGTVLRSIIRWLRSPIGATP
jgi:hypothetical protein